MTMRETHGWMTASLLPALLLIGAVALSGCGGPVPNDMDGEWAGTLHTEQGRCPDRAPSRLLVDAGAVRFVPAGGVLVLTGHHDQGGSRVHAQVALTDMNHKPLPMVFEGTLAPDGQQIAGSFGSPACRASVVLLRPTDHGLSRVLGN